MIHTIKCRELHDPGGGMVYYHWFKTEGPEIAAAQVTDKPVLRFAVVRPTKVKTEFRFLVVAGDGDLCNPNPQHVSLVTGGE